MSNSSDPPDPDRTGEASGDEMFWDSQPFVARIQSRKGASEKTLGQGFSLIGSDKCCPLRIAGTGMPPVAYFVCSLRNHIEVWPLAAIAFARWGPIRPDSDLLVGQNRLNFLRVSETASTPPAVSSSEAAGTLDAAAATQASAGSRPIAAVGEDEIHTTLTYRGSQIKKRFRRPVTIIGGDHPSVIRLNGWGLEACHYAAVVQDGELWVVDLTAREIPLEERVQRLPRPGSTARLGGVELKMVSVQSRAAESAPEPLPHDTGEAVQGEAVQGEAVQVRLAKRRPEDTDALTSRVTDRLISIGRTRTLRRKILLSLAFVMALAAVAWILFRLLGHMEWNWF